MSSNQISENQTKVPLIMTFPEQILTSKGFVAAMCISLVAGIILASISCSPAVGHAIGTVVPQAAGGVLIGIALIGLAAHVRKDSEIQWRTSSFAHLFEANPDAKPISPEEFQQAVEDQAEEGRKALECLND